MRHNQKSHNFSISFNAKSNFGQPIFSVDAQNKLDELRQKELEATQALENSRVQALENFKGEIQSLAGKLGLTDLDEVKSAIEAVQSGESLDQFSETLGFNSPETAKMNYAPEKIVNNPFRSSYVSKRGKKILTVIRSAVREELRNESLTGQEIAEKFKISLASVNNIKKQFSLSNRRS